VTLFSLDPQIERDSRFICDLQLSQLRLLNDCRFPWVLLIPRSSGITEIFELDEPQAKQLMTEIRRVSAVMKQLFACTKINVAALGNKVRQLHVHVIARSTGDEAWPDTPWGKGASRPYGEAELQKRLAELVRALD
jgi:diadenosine tetraphosphate (Ap4A) HIT family hydrolase